MKLERCRSSPCPIEREGEREPPPETAEAQFVGNCFQRARVRVVWNQGLLAYRPRAKTPPPHGEPLHAVQFLFFIFEKYQSNYISFFAAYSFHKARIRCVAPFRSALLSRESFFFLYFFSFSLSLSPQTRAFRTHVGGRGSSSCTLWQADGGITFLRNRKASRL